MQTVQHRFLNRFYVKKPVKTGLEKCKKPPALSISKHFQKKIMNKIKKALTRCLVHNTVLVRVSDRTFGTRKGTQASPGRSVTHAKQKKKLNLIRIQLSARHECQGWGLKKQILTTLHKYTDCLCKGSDFYSISKLFQKKNNEYDKKKALTQCLVHNTVLVRVSDRTFNTGKGRTQELLGRSVTRAKQIFLKKADKNTTEGRDSGATGQICNTSKT